MSVIKLVISMLFIAIVMWIFIRVMAFVGKMLHISEIIVTLSNALKNVFIKILISVTSVFTFLLVIRGSIDGIYAAVCFLVLLLTFIDLSKIENNGEEDVV